VKATWEAKKYSDKPLTGTLELSWELECAAFSDNFLRTDAPQSVWTAFIHGQVNGGKYDPENWPILWFVDNDATGIEEAPFQDDWYKLVGLEPQDDHCFLDYFTWPKLPDGSRISWLEVPVADEVWTTKHTTKNGFIKAATGWAPSPFQNSVNLRTIARAANVTVPA
jgi:hypothetical protein